MPTTNIKTLLKASYYSCVFSIYDKILYDKLPKLYDLTFGSSSEFKNAFKRILYNIKAGSILDVACGTGTLLFQANLKELECYGVDLSKGMLNRAKLKVPNAKLKQGDFENIPFGNNTFDYVVSTNAIGSVKVNPTRVVAEMIRVCKKGGEVRIADYNLPTVYTYKNKILIKFFRFLGDNPYNFTQIFKKQGYKPEVESLGLFGTYQLLKIKK